MTSRLQHKIEHLASIKNDYYVFVEGVRDINDYVDDISSDNVNRSREANNGSKSKARTIVGYVVKGYRKESISLERTTKIEGHSITRFSTYIRQKILNEGRCFKCLEKEHRSTEDDAPCKHQSIVGKDEAILKLAAIDIVWDEVDGKNYFFEEEAQYHSKN